ncbi:aurora kinase C-like [Octopus sinensis]|uniref:Aurora kinase C-like n=1 Tax=Octopus sinensis TaxID=2607531 RepID=A0A7E6EJ39_9MOLL|nr:aurora kinase C-like [Octopus sinensis]
MCDNKKENKDRICNKSNRLRQTPQKRNNQRLPRNRVPLPFEVSGVSHTRHPYILRLFDYFYDDETVYLVMEHAINGSLEDKLQARGALTEREASRPANVLFALHDIVRLSDFGISVHPDASRCITMGGTVEYMSPEVVRGLGYDHSVDIWALGVLSYELLVGKTPFSHSIDSKKCRELILLSNSDSWIEAGTVRGKCVVVHLNNFDTVEEITSKEVFFILYHKDWFYFKFTVTDGEMKEYKGEIHIGSANQAVLSPQPSCTNKNI